ncbi:MAG: hypothetical protein QM680_11780 [Luteolibacter sp.]
MMQAVAWATMLVDYSKEDGFLQGARDTFSGEKPCDMCRKIQASKQTEPKEKAPVVPLSSLSFKAMHELLPVEILALTAPRPVLVPPVTFTDFLPVRGIGPSSPPVPPPDVSIA